jgi:hypothetical protein
MDSFGEIAANFVYTGGATIAKNVASRTDWIKPKLVSANSPIQIGTESYNNMSGTDRGMFVACFSCLFEWQTRVTNEHER